MQLKDVLAKFKTGSKILFMSCRFLLMVCCVAPANSSMRSGQPNAAGSRMLLYAGHVFTNLTFHSSRGMPFS